jgi:hypothetical protein
MTTKPQDNLRNGEPCADGVTCIVSIAAAEEAAAHIDTQAAKIKALVEYVESIADWMASNGYDNTSDLAFLAAAKETT